MEANKIVIVRGEHPLEVSARYLARDVSKDLTRRGYATHTVTVPFNRTHFAHTLGSTSEYATTIELLENVGLNPSETFYFNFHNYKLPDDFGVRRPNSKIFRFTLSTNWEKKFGCIGYNFQKLDESEGWCDEWYDDGLYGEDFAVINSVIYEIPAFFRKLPERILEKCGGKYISSSSRIYDNLVVNFKKTKEAGFLDEIVVKSLADSILRLHEKYPKPLKISWDDLEV